MHFPVSDVVKNVRYFITVVKRATGNIRDPLADANKKESSQKPGKLCMHRRGSPRSTHISLSERNYPCSSQYSAGPEHTDLGRVELPVPQYYPRPRYILSY